MWYRKCTDDLELTSCVVWLSVCPEITSMWKWRCDLMRHGCPGQGVPCAASEQGHPVAPVHQLPATCQEAVVADATRRTGWAKFPSPTGCKLLNMRGLTPWRKGIWHNDCNISYISDEHRRCLVQFARLVPGPACVHRCSWSVSSQHSLCDS